MSPKTTKFRKGNVRSKTSRNGSSGVTTLLQDPLFNFEGLRDLVEDSVKLLLAAYFKEDSCVHPFGIGSDDAPVKVVCYSPSYGREVTHFFRRPSGSYYADFNTVYRLATEVLSVYGRAYLLVFPEREKYLTEQELIKTLIHWVFLFLEDTWVSELKNRLLTAFSRSEKEPEPVYATPHHRTHVFLGTFGKMAYRDMFRNCRNGKIWRNTVLHGIKKGMPTVSDDFVAKALKDHGELLSTEGDSRVEFIELVEKISDIVFRGIKPNEPKVTHKLSQNSCVENPRSELGAYGVLSNVWDPSWCLSDHHELILMQWHPVKGVLEVRTNKFDAPIHDRTLDIIGPTKWEVEIIREPLKVRSITKGEAMRNAAFSDVQKDLWLALQKYKCFRLTKGDNVEKSINELRPLLSKTISAHFLSGDYKAATDSILAEVMEAGIFGIKHPMLRNFLMDNLSNGVISYEGICKRMKIECPPPCIQKRGQLMGSIFSFPILCVINLATYIATALRSNSVFTEEEKRKGLEYMIANAPVLVNGDDILFESPSRRFTEIWEWNATGAGFKLSVGKTYYSSKFAVVNSTYYQTSTKKVVPYVNMGIVKGKKKGDDDSRIGASSFREKMASLPGYFRDLWKNFSFSEMKSGLWQRMIDYCWNLREDVKLSKWSKETLGLVQIGGVSDWEPYLKDLYKLNGKTVPEEIRNDRLDDFIWRGRKEIDTNILRKREPVLKAPVPLIPFTQSRLIKEYWLEKKQERYDNWWYSSVTRLCCQIAI